MPATEKAYTVFQGRAGDPDDLAMSGARATGDYLARRTGMQPRIPGKPEAALNRGWREELEAAMPNLRAVKARFEEVLTSGAVSVAAIRRCVVARYAARSGKVSS